MKRVNSILCGSVLAGLLLSSTAFAAKAIIVTNNTQATLSELYASSSSAGDWNSSNPNLLAGNPLAPGQHRTVSVDDGTSDCAYDLMGVLSGAAQHAYQYQVNACSGSGSWTVSQQ